MTPSASAFLVSFLLAHHHQSGIAFPTRTLRPHAERIFVSRTPIATSPANDEGHQEDLAVDTSPAAAGDDHEEAYDPEEFLGEVNFTASVINGQVIHNSPQDPLQSMGNLTQKLRTLSTQFEYQLTLARDNRYQLEDDLEQAQADRKKLQSLIIEIRRDRDALAETLNETRRSYQKEQKEQTGRIQTLQASLSKQTKALENEQANAQALKRTCNLKEEQIRETETSSRRLLTLLWRLMQRRIRNWVVFTFPILFRMIESIFHFMFGDNTEEECVEAPEPPTVAS